MSTFTAVGPALDIDGPLPTRPPFSLLEIPGVLQEGEGRWLNGVNVYGYPEGTPGAWEPCSTGTFRQKDEGGEVSTPRFDPVGLYQAITCSALNFGDNWRDFAERAERALDARLSFGVERVLSQGVTLSTNPFLGDSDVTVLGGGAVTPIVALSWLEQAIGETGQRGMIHADPATVAAWSAYLRVDGNTLYTFNDTPVAAGGGYIGGDAGASSPGTGQSYAYATGPVEVFVGDPQLVGGDINGTLDTSNNDVTFRAERFVLAEWDTALQAAVLVDWTP